MSLFQLGTGAGRVVPLQPDPTINPLCLGPSGTLPPLLEVLHSQRIHRVSSPWTMGVAHIRPSHHGSPHQGHRTEELPRMDQTLSVHVQVGNT